MIETLKKRRSIRKYKDIPVEQDKIDNIIKAALLAPTGKNKKPWEFIVVTDNTILNKLGNVKPKGGQFVKDAPLAIVVIGNAELSDTWVEDTSITAAYIQLQAHVLGLGSCWSQIRNRIYDDKESASGYIKKVLNIPNQYEVECIIGIGYSDEDKKYYSDEELDFNKIHNNKFR